MTHARNGEKAGRVEAAKYEVVGGTRCIVAQPGSAEVGFAVVDKYQGQGVGAALMQHLAIIARQVGSKELIAEVLPDNIPMLKVLKKSGLRPSVKQDGGIVHTTLKLL